MVSMSTARWSSPRPLTRKRSAASVSSTCRPRLTSSSLYRRARNCRVVENLPSRPVNGDVLTPNVILTVGSSISMRGSGSGDSGSASVSPIATSSSPVRTTMSPALTVGAEHGDRIAWRDTASGDAPDGHRTRVVIVGAVGDQHLKATGLSHRRRDEVDDRLEKRLEVGLQLVWFEAGPPFFRDRVHDRR